MKALLGLIRANKAGQNCGIYSVCSAHPLVLRAALTQAKQDQQLLLIEATTILPCCENLIALPIRLAKICLK